jgi:hypothetical protein
MIPLCRMLITPTNMLAQARAATAPAADVAEAT